MTERATLYLGRQVCTVYRHGQQCHYVGMKLSDYVAAASISCFIQAHCFCGAAGSFHHNYLMLNTDK